MIRWQHSCKLKTGCFRAPFFVGAAVAGPVGVVVGGTLGALIGHDVVQERALARKNQELADLNREIVDARSQLARVNAEQAKTQAELVALQELLTDLSVAVHFDVNSAMTASQYRQALQAVAKASRSIDGLTVRLVGHADPRGTEAYNQNLSAKIRKKPTVRISLRRAEKSTN